MRGILKNIAALFGVLCALKSPRARWHGFCSSSRVRTLLAVSFILVAALARGGNGAAASSEFPFEYREGLLWVQVRVAGSTQPLNFLFDTGAEVSAIDVSAARRIGLLLGPKVSVRGVGTTMSGHWPQTVCASAAGVALPSELLALDLSKLGRACQQPVDGLIGADFIRGRIVQIDFDASCIRLLKPEELPVSARALPLDVRCCGLRVKAGVNGNKPQWLRVDTGCATALHWVTTGVRPDECGGRLAIGLAEMKIPQTLTTVELGGQTFRNVPTGIHRAAIFAGESGLLGNGLLSRFGSVTIDARAGSLLLGPVRQSE